MVEEPLDPNRWAAIPMSPEARAYLQQSFYRRYQDLQTKINSIPLVVLVWGPGESRDDLFEKRLQIRGRLRELGYAAVFSEEIDEECGISFRSAKARELLQAIEADFIVILHASIGSIAESHDFAGFTSIGSKMLVFVDSRHRNGYSYSGALTELNDLYSNVSSFEYPKDVIECNLLSAVLRRLGSLRLAKWRSELR